MWYTEEEEECSCNHGIIMGWWHIFTEKIIPLKRTWSEEERKAMR